MRRNYKEETLKSLGDFLSNHLHYPKPDRTECFQTFFIIDKPGVINRLFILFVLLNELGKIAIHTSGDTAKYIIYSNLFFLQK